MINKFIRHIRFRAKQIDAAFSRSPFFCSDYAHTIRTFREVFGYELNLENPTTFNEKINWRKLFDRRSLFTQLSDKLAVRDYVSQHIGKDYLIDILQVVKKPEQINFDCLPNAFVIKANHGSGMNWMVHDKTKLQLQELMATCRSWLKTNYYTQGREWGYKHIKPRLMVEPLLKREGLDTLGYKFFCFDGQVKTILFDIVRKPIRFRNLYSRSWEDMSFSYTYPNAPFKVQPPPELKQMIAIAEKLSAGFDFLRIDLYNHFGKIYFNEITIYPFAGYAKLQPEKFDAVLGSYWTLPELEKIRWTGTRKILDALDYLFTKAPG